MIGSVTEPSLLVVVCGNSELQADRKLHTTKNMLKAEIFGSMCRSWIEIFIKNGIPIWELTKSSKWDKMSSDTRSNSYFETEDELNMLWNEQVKLILEGSSYAAFYGYEFDDIYLWPILKSLVVMRFLNRFQNAPFWKRPPSKQKLIAKAIKRVSARRGPKIEPIVNDIEINVDSIESLFLGHSAPLNFKRDEIINPHMDPLRTALQQSESQSLTLYYDSYCSSENFYHHSIGIKLIADRITARATKSVSKLDAPKAAFELMLREVEGLSLGITIQDLLVRLQTVRFAREWFKDLFDQSRSLQHFLVTNYYSPICWGGVIAATERGLDCIDIQHGIQGPYHHAYSGLSRVPETMRPNRFLVWHPQSVTQIENQVGSGSAFNMGISSLRAIKLSTSVTPRQTKAIVGIFVQYLETSQWLHELRNLIPETVELWVRHHPGAIARGTEIEIPKGCRNVDHLDMADILSNIQMTITGYSTVAIESAGLNIPVIAHSRVAKDMIGYAIPPNLIEYVSSNPESIAQALSLSLERPRSFKRPDIPDIFEVADWVLKG